MTQGAVNASALRGGQKGERTPAAVASEALQPLAFEALAATKAMLVLIQVS
jgi:hypothetical protein